MVSVINRHLSCPVSSDPGILTSSVITHIVKKNIIYLLFILSLPQQLTLFLCSVFPWCLLMLLSQSTQLPLAVAVLCYCPFSNLQLRYHFEAVSFITFVNQNMPPSILKNACSNKVCNTDQSPAVLLIWKPRHTVCNVLLTLFFWRLTFVLMAIWAWSVFIVIAFPRCNCWA